jgi:hypothetical protein
MNLVVYGVVDKGVKWGIINIKKLPGGHWPFFEMTCLGEHISFEEAVSGATVKGSAPLGFLITIFPSFLNYYFSLLLSFLNIFQFCFKYVYCYIHYQTNDF